MLELDEIRTEIFLKLDEIFPDFWADIQFTKIDPEVSSRSAPACRFNTSAVSGEHRAVTGRSISPKLT